MKKILLVEDHADTRVVLAMSLTSAGYDVVTAKDACEAMDIAVHEPIDLIISDVGLPGCDGLTLLKKIHSAYHIPGISMSGFSSYEGGEASREAGCAGHLVKPLDFDAMLGMISKTLHN